MKTGVVNNLVDFVCLTRIPYRSEVGTQERYFETLAEAQADATANSGVADEVSCPPLSVPMASGTALAMLGLLLAIATGALVHLRRSN